VGSVGVTGSALLGVVDAGVGAVTASLQPSALAANVMMAIRVQVVVRIGGVVVS
jgi:hypothetical protein